MNPWMRQISAFIGPHAARLASMTAPIFVIMMLAMMVLPLPPFVLDLLFTFNIAMALMVMMVSAHMVRPLDFSALPSVLQRHPRTSTLKGGPAGRGSAS